MLELSLGETLVAQPESAAVVDQGLDGGTPPVAEYEDCAAEGIGRQVGPAQLGHAVDALAEVRRLDRDQDPHLRCQLDHAGLGPQKAAMMLSTAA